MFQAITMTDALSVWIDSPSEDRLGYGGSSRVQIMANPPSAVVDWREGGDGYEIVLLGGLWPDDDELRCMVLGLVPNSPEAEAFISEQLPNPDELDPIDALRKVVTVMPLFGGCVRRMLFVAEGTPRYIQETIAPGTAAITGRTLKKMAFGEWRLMLDLALRKAGLPMSEDLDSVVSLADLEEWHGDGSRESTIEGAVDEIRTRRNGQSVSDQHVAGDDTS